MAMCGLCVIPFVHLLEAVAIAHHLRLKLPHGDASYNLAKVRINRNLATPQARTYIVLRHSVLNAHLLNNVAGIALDRLYALGHKLDSY